MMVEAGLAPSMAEVVDDGVTVEVQNFLKFF